MKFQKERLKGLNSKEVGKGPVLYFMDRDRRINDNWAVLYARHLAEVNDVELHVVYVLPPTFLESSLRQHDFMIKGLQECEKLCQDLGIRFEAFGGGPVEEVTAYVERYNCGVVITDFSPLKLPRKWRSELAKKLPCRMLEVDAHNVVPCWHASDKKEFAAYTLRPKINKLLDEFLIDIPEVLPVTKKAKCPGTDWDAIWKSLDIDMNVEPVDWIIPGEEAAKKAMDKFLGDKIFDYDEKRNDPNAEAISDLSPYLHYGQLSAQRLALEAVAQAPEHSDSFIEELVVRKELADNFCYYCSDYDNFNGFHQWAQETLNAHRSDNREYVYSLKEFEEANTHDELWNAAQQEMLQRGKMHGYMRMYWAKKILEWTKSPEDAMKIAIYLNDKYELDGRDPNGYTGLAWSIGGVHDRAWTEREVYGKIRYMNYNGCRRKFDIKAYMDKWLGAPVQDSLI
jgi:deoxyribodipyrimidine photo-lyase